MKAQDERRAKLEFHRSALASLRAAYLALVDGGVQSYSIGSRSLTKLDLSKIMDEIKVHEKAVNELEQIIASGKRRWAVGVVPRDW